MNEIMERECIGRRKGNEGKWTGIRGEGDRR